MESLFTPQDGRYGHIHKVLGLVALFNYILQFGNLFVYGKMMFNQTSWFLIGVHLLLSWSSFIFHLPPIRSERAPMIWPEFRAHSILFATRSLVVMALTLSGFSNLCTRFATVLGTIILADLATKYYKITVTTMRDMPFPDWVTQKARNRINLYYSISQVFATAGLLFSPSMDRAYCILFPIQIAAFLMTLVRKRIIGPLSWHVFYALALALNYLQGALSTEVLPIQFWVASFMFCVLRFGFHMNKYALWIAIGIGSIVNSQLMIIKAWPINETT
jgi:hypothetical protein